MRDPNRIMPLIMKVAEAWYAYPDMRFMQLMCNVQRMLGSDGWYVEDYELADYLDQLIAASPHTANQE